MTKRELINQILTENQTAEPAFLAQFSDEQLRDYLSHLQGAGQPKMSGNAARFERYFRNCPKAPVPPSERRWRSDGDSPTASAPEGLDPPAPAVLPSAFRARQHLPLQPPMPAVVEEPDLPPLGPTDFEAPLPQDARTLESMQLSVQERTSLKNPPAPDPDQEEEASSAGRGRDAPQAPFAEPDPDEQTWLF